MPRVVVVDGANVVGSRPDGWWRDRPGAARRLHDGLAASDLAVAEVVLVLEGAARRGVPAGWSGEVLTVHATGSGDDTIVATVTGLVRTDAAAEVVVVTADRELRSRVAREGAECRGPTWLLDRL